MFLVFLEVNRRILKVHAPPSLLRVGLVGGRALEVIKELLQKDDSWKSRTYLNASQVTTLLEFCLTTTYFKFRRQIYQQDHGCAMGLPFSLIIANLYMENFEVKAITSASHLPRIWMRYVDDTFVVIDKDRAQDFTDHINSFDPHIKFTNDPEREGCLPFLDTLVTRQADGSVKVSVYRKPTHTDSAQT